MRVSLVMTVVVAGLCLFQKPVYGRGFSDFYRGGEELLIGDNPLPDYNENFFSAGLLKGPFAVWTPKLQRLQNEIDKNVVLPQSLVRSFLLVAEKTLMPPPKHELLDLDSVAKFSQPIAKEAIIQGLFYKKGAEDGVGYFADFKKAAEKNMQATLREFNEITKDDNPTIQVLVGAPGAAGVTTLIERYAAVTGRPVVNLKIPLYDLSGEKLAFAVENIAHQAIAPIFVIDKINHLDQADLLRLQTFINHRRLLGNSTVILAFDGPRYEEHFQAEAPPVKYIVDAMTLRTHTAANLTLQSIVREADSVHFFRQPQSPEYYVTLIDRLSPQLLHALGVRKKFYGSAYLPKTHSAVQNLARVAFKYQVIVGTFPMERLTKGMFGLDRDKFSCDDLFMRANTLEKNNVAAELETALTAYKEALEEQVHVPNFFSSKFNIW